MPIEKVKHQSPLALIPRQTNPRTHTKKQIRQIAASIEQFGFVNPVLVDKGGGIVAGHGRVEAAKLLGLKSIPTICLEHLNDAEIRAYVIADNRLAELAGWDDRILSIELQELSGLDLGFDLTIIGFETPEIDLLIAGAETDDEDPDDDVPPVEDGPPVTQPGDVWCIGNHRLICGDATHRETYTRLLEGAMAQMVFSDPPYNVPIDGHVCGLGTNKHREFAMAVGEMSPAEFADFLNSVFGELARHSAEGSIHFVCMDWRHIGEIVAAGHECYSELKNVCVWTKSNGGMGSLYRSQYELVFVFKNGSAAHVNNVALGKYGRYRTNVWSYPGINSFGHDRKAGLALHPTIKPVKLVSDAILDCSKRNAIVLDAFAGSGTTLLAAEKTGRRGYAIELDPNYCDVIVRRMQAATGLEPVHRDSGRSFSLIAEERAYEAQLPLNLKSREVDNVGR